MNVVAGRLGATYADTNAGWGARVISAQEQLVTTVRPALLLISAAVGFLLLIVCANVANLILARLSSRRTEIAVRAALGAGRMQIVRQVLAESFVLSAIGGTLGLFVAWAGIRFVRALPEGSLPRMQQVQLDGGVLLFALAASVSRCPGVRSRARDAGIARRAARHDQRLLGHDDSIPFAPRCAGGSGSRARADAARRRRADDAQLRAVDAGVAGIRAAQSARGADLSAGREYKNALERTRFYKDAIHRIAALPGVESTAAVSALPMYPVGIDFALPFTIEGKSAPTNGEEPRADIRMATPKYFETMKMPLLKGRFIDERDLPGLPGAMVINETMARRYFPGEDPLGKVVRNPHGKAEVVGIVGDTKHYGLDREPRAELFMPAYQQMLAGMALIVRTSSDPTPFIETIRRQVQDIDAEQAIRDASPMVDVVSRSVFLPRISMLLLGAFAISALLLAVVGIYGVVSYTVTQRTRELGVRMALGAGSADTLGLVLRRSMWLVGAGTLAGLLGSVGLTRAMSGLLYEVSPLDPLVFIGVSSLLAGAGLVASLIPARRATRVDPIIALRVQ